MLVVELEAATRVASSRLCVSAFDRHRGQAALADGQRHQWIQRRLACGHGQHYLVSRTAMYTDCDSKCHIQAYANCDAYSYSYTYEYAQRYANCNSYC